MPQTVLLTAFGAFGAFSTNPTEAVLERLKEMSGSTVFGSHDVQLVGENLRVAYDEADELVPAMWKKWQPQVIITIN